VARDIRTRAYLLYFSKPITPTEYLAGKGGVVASYVALVTLVPAFLLYAISIAFAPSASALAQTWPTVLRILAAGVVLVVPTVSVMLFLSSMVRDARYAAFGWIVPCVFGEVAYQALRTTPDLREAKWLYLLSPRSTITSVYQRIFDVGNQAEILGESRRLHWLTSDLKPDECATVSALILLGVSISCLVAVRCRIGRVLKS
jgi:hypothetical protein